LSRPPRRRERLARSGRNRRTARGARPGTCPVSTVVRVEGGRCRGRYRLRRCLAPRPPVKIVFTSSETSVPNAGAPITPATPVGLRQSTHCRSTAGRPLVSRLWSAPSLVNARICSTAATSRGISLSIFTMFRSPATECVAKLDWPKKCACTSLRTQLRVGPAQGRIERVRSRSGQTSDPPRSRPAGTPSADN
jgi:hypothetical protein